MLDHANNSQTNTYSNSYTSIRFDRTSATKYPRPTFTIGNVLNTFKTAVSSEIDYETLSVLEL